MDIAYLLFLQDFRQNIDNILTPLLEGISSFAVVYIVLAAVLLYWCVDKRKGLYTLGSFVVAITLTNLLKLTACVYRPWICDARILPAGNATATATGYSFPSGHSATAASIYGGVAVGCWDQKRTRWISVLCAVFILLTGFSRNYLGVHTPQDVFAGLALGILALIGMARLMDYVEKHPQSENYLLLSGLLAAILMLIYITLKPYPVDYVNGRLLVDPIRMMDDGFRAAGALIGLCVGRYLEKSWVRFRPVGLRPKGVLLSIAGLIPLYFLIFKNPLVQWWGHHWGFMAAQALIFIYILALYPWVLKRFSSHR